MWTILPRAVSGVRKKTAVWSKQSVRTIYNSEQYILAWLSGCGPFKICLTWCDLFKCPQSNFKSRCKSKLRARQMTKVMLDLGWNATLFRPGAPPVEEAKGGLHNPSVLMDCIVCWSHIDHDPHGLMDLRCSSKKLVYLAIICTCLSAFQRLTLHNSKPHVLSNYASSDESKWFFCKV